MTHPLPILPKSQRSVHTWLQVQPGGSIFEASCCGFRLPKEVISQQAPGCPQCGSPIVDYRYCEPSASAPPATFDSDSTPKMQARAYLLPRIVHSLVHIGSGSWIVGSVADPNKTFDAQNLPKDYDILVPYSEWLAVSMQLPNQGTVVGMTRFGGFRMRLNTDEMLDIWPGELSAFFLNPPTKYAWHPKSMTLLSKV